MKAKIKVFHIYNLGFFGGNREGKLNIDGQYKFITDFKEFAIVKFGGYGNLTSFPEVEFTTTQELTQPEYRFASDALFKAVRGSHGNFTDAEADEIELFVSGKRYPYNKKRVSANIQFGDAVLDIEKNETFKVSSMHDLRYINRNFNYKLVDRELHPEPATLAEVIEATNKKNPFERWTKLEAMPKLKNMLVDSYTINGQKYVASHAGDDYYMQTPQGDVYHLRSNISAPYYDTIDLLTGYVSCKYVDGNPVHKVFNTVVHEEVSGHSFFHPRRFELAKAKKAYEYNTRLTHF